MRFVRFQGPEGPTLGLLQGEQITPILNAADLQTVILRGADYELELDSACTVPADQVKLLAPIEPSRHLFCVGWNYLKHYTESVGKREGQDQDLPVKPTLFTKPTTSVAHPNQSLPLHATLTSKLDWEVELAVIIGKGGCDISEEHALRHVFGYTVSNDISARDLQRAHGGQWFKGKSLDGTCPLGPCVVTADELGDPQKLDISCHLNGQLMQSSNTRRQIFPVARLIAELSAGMTLLPGDIILTGTPEGIGAARTPPVFIREGDQIECTVQGIGTLKNHFSQSQAC